MRNASSNLLMGMNEQTNDSTMQAGCLTWMKEKGDDYTFCLNVVIEERMWNWWFLFQVINVVSNVWQYNIGHPTESVLTDKCLICDPIWLWCDENLSYFRAMSVPDLIVQWNNCMMKVWDILIFSSWNHYMSATPLISPPPFFSPVAASSSLTDLCIEDN